jgi:hypothetical protein
LVAVVPVLVGAGPFRFRNRCHCCDRQMGTHRCCFSLIFLCLTFLVVAKIVKKRKWTLRGGTNEGSSTPNWKIVIFFRTGDSKWSLVITWRPLFNGNLLGIAWIRNGLVLVVFQPNVKHNAALGTILT